jgi:hypothetical protein
VVGEFAGDLVYAQPSLCGIDRPWPSAEIQEREDERHAREPLERVAPCRAQRTTRTTILSATRATTRPGPRLAPPKLLSSTTA